MNDFRNRISYSAEFDDARYWSFVRDSKLPYGTFGRPRSADWWVVAFCAVIVVLLPALALL